MDKFPVYRKKIHQIFLWTNFPSIEKKFAVSQDFDFLYTKKKNRIFPRLLLFLKKHFPIFTFSTACFQYKKFQCPTGSSSRYLICAMEKNSQSQGIQFCLIIHFAIPQNNFFWKKICIFPGLFIEANIRSPGQKKKKGPNIFYRKKSTSFKKNWFFIEKNYHRMVSIKNPYSHRFAFFLQKKINSPSLENDFFSIDEIKLFRIISIP